jgi:peptidoglycan/xylan/chitin deacetylase (PgdA/CDA1 family)
MLRLIVVVGALLPLLAHAQSVALTFDDGFEPRTQLRAAAWNSAMLRALADARVTSILFPAGKRVDGAAGMELVRNWGLAGHEVGNHTYSHLDLSAAGTTLQAYVADVEREEALLRGMPGWTPRFRFPYLKEGETAAKRDGMRQWLGDHHYGSGAVSIDASDWYYNDRYDRWRSNHPTADLGPYRTAYLEHLWGRAQYYDGLSRQLLGRSAKHVVILHTNRLNAQFLPDVIAMFRSKGWMVIAPEEAYEDPLYAMRTATLPAGESILWSLAKEAGMANLRYPAEDGEYEKPILDRLGL